MHRLWRSLGAAGPLRPGLLSRGWGAAGNRAVARWCEVETAAPDLAARVRELLEAHRHKTIASLRRDGAPRISGTEAQFRDGDLWIGSMLGARKAVDLQRDPRFALHSGSDDPPTWRGDAKVSGRMIEITDPARVAEINGPEVGPSHLFRADIEEISTVRLNAGGDRLVVESWREGGTTARLER